MLIVSRRLLSSSCSDLIECLFELVPLRLAASLLKLLYQVPKIISTFVLVHFNFLFGKFQYAGNLFTFYQIPTNGLTANVICKNIGSGKPVPTLSAEVLKT